MSNLPYHPHQYCNKFIVQRNCDGKFALFHQYNADSCKTAAPLMSWVVNRDNATLLDSMDDFTDALGVLDSYIVIPANEKQVDILMYQGLNDFCMTNDELEKIRNLMITYANDCVFDSQCTVENVKLFKELVSEKGKSGPRTA